MTEPWAFEVCPALIAQADRPMFRDDGRPNVEHGYYRLRVRGWRRLFRRWETRCLYCGARWPDGYPPTGWGTWVDP